MLCLYVMPVCYICLLHLSGIPVSYIYLLYTCLSYLSATPVCDRCIYICYACLLCLYAMPVCIICLLYILYVCHICLLCYVMLCSVCLSAMPISDTCLLCLSGMPVFIPVLSACYACWLNVNVMLDHRLLLWRILPSTQGQHVGLCLGHLFCLSVAGRQGLKLLVWQMTIPFDEEPSQTYP